MNMQYVGIPNLFIALVTSIIPIMSWDWLSALSDNA